MGNFKTLVIIVISLVFINSCSNDDVYNYNEEPEAKYIALDKADSKSATLVFGRYYGKCQGNYCVKIFKLKNKQLKAEVKSTMPILGTYYDGDFSKIKVSDKVNITELFSEFPTFLLGSKEEFSVIGTPDAGDWGGLYLEYNDAKLHKQWFLDLNTNNVPKELINYVFLINEKINLIEDIK